MKIAIASDDQKMIAGHFGRTLGFLIYEIENGMVKSREYRENDFTGHTRGMNGAGHGHHGHESILAALEGCQAVISRGMGRRIYHDLQTVGIEAFIVQETEADQAIEKYLQNQLQNFPDQGCEH